MKNYLPVILVCVTLTLLCACIPPKSPDTVYDAGMGYSLQNIAYGTHAEQKMDMYLPANRSQGSTKVFVLVHGGGWSGGSKADFTDYFNNLKTLYPNHGVINLNYRLGTAGSPGFPKQIDDITAAISEAQKPKYNLGNKYFMIGASAGGHLSMLYGYAHNPAHEVKGICNIVGPADLTDSAYMYNTYYQGIFVALVGNGALTPDSALLASVSPTKKVTPQAPPTISFYGNADPLVPSTQMGLLRDSLNAHGVYNENTMYVGGHGNWSALDNADAFSKIINFINARF